MHPENKESNGQMNYATLPPVGDAHALPEVGAPTPPPNVSPVDRKGGRRLKAYRAQLDVALEAAAELRRSTLFPLVFGSRYAVAEDVANAVEFAARWSREARAAKAWASYASLQSELAWNFVHALLKKLRAPFSAAAASDSSLANELHAFARLLTARSDAAKRAAAKRSAKQKQEGDPTPRIAIVDLLGSAPPSSSHEASSP